MSQRCSSCSKCSLDACQCWNTATRAAAREDGGAAEIKGASVEVDVRMCDAVTSTSTARPSVRVLDSLDTAALADCDAAMLAVSVEVDGVTMLLAAVCDADDGSDAVADAGADVEGEGNECAIDIDTDVETEVDVEDEVGLQHSSGSSNAPRACD